MSLRELTLDDVASALDRLDHNCRETWVQMGMAIKTEFGDLGWDTWLEWSQRSDSFELVAAKATWKSFSKGGIGIGTLVAAAREAGWEFRPGELGQDERRRRREAADQRRKDLAAEIEADEKARAEWHERNAAAALEIDGLLEWGGRSDYLARKKVPPFGVRFVPHGFVILTDLKAQRIDLITGRDAVSSFFGKLKEQEIDREAVSFKYIRFGALAVPMRDEQGRLWAWQFIPEAPGASKQFMKSARKSGLFHFIAEHAGSYQKREALAEHLFSSPPAAIAQAEGYATAASIHQATGYPVAVAFDAGNMPHVATALRAAFQDVPLLMCGDNDRDTEGNPGLKKARQAAERVKGFAVVPDFTPFETATTEGAA